MPGRPKKKAQKQVAEKAIHEVSLKRIGRPKGSDEYDPVIAEKICDLIEYEGFWAESAANVFGFTRKTLENWAKVHAEFSSAYARARENAAYAHAKKSIDTLEIAARDKDLSSPQINAAKNLAAGYQWYASKLQPRVYGDKLDLTATVGVIQLTDNQIDAKLDALLAMMARSKNG